MSVVLMGEGVSELEVGGVTGTEHNRGLIGETNGFPGGLKLCIWD